jgi:hypothetical protein
MFVWNIPIYTATTHRQMSKQHSHRQQARPTVTGNALLIGYCSCPQSEAACCRALCQGDVCGAKLFLQGPTPDTTDQQAFSGWQMQSGHHTSLSRCPCRICGRRVINSLCCPIFLQSARHLQASDSNQRPANQYAVAWSCA